MMVVIGVLWPLLCTWQAKWAERPPKVMKRSQRRNNLQICPRRYSNSCGSAMQSNALPLDHGGAPYNDARYTTGGRKPIYNTQQRLPPTGPSSVGLSRSSLCRPMKDLQSGSRQHSFPGIIVEFVITTEGAVATWTLTSYGSHFLNVRLHGLMYPTSTRKKNSRQKCQQTNCTYCTRP